MTDSSGEARTPQEGRCAALHPKSGQRCERRVDHKGDHHITNQNLGGGLRIGPSKWAQEGSALVEVEAILRRGLALTEKGDEALAALDSLRARLEAAEQRVKELEREKELLIEESNLILAQLAERDKRTEETAEYHQRQAALQFGYVKEQAKQMEELERENKRLREALREVGNAYGCYAGCTGALPGAPDRSHSPVCAAARFALAQSDPPGEAA